MADGYGASQDAWHHFASMLGLKADLLPVVSNPNIAISPDSKMGALGKTPSILNFRGEAAGFPKWTEHSASDRDIGKWECEPDYGIAIQCRTIRAIDIDVPDKVKAAKILGQIEMSLPYAFFPERHRDGTGKTLLAFRFPYPMPKRVIPVDGGVIEFLGDGQQFIADGAYIKDGEAQGRYKWRGGLPTEFPVLTPAELEMVWDALCVMFATGDPKRARERRVMNEGGVAGWTGGADPVADWLMEKWDVFDQGRDGELYIECPFVVEHTSPSGTTATAYFSAGTGGYERGHFVCLHAHCTGRPDSDFRSAIGYEQAQFPDLSDEPEINAAGLVTIDAPTEVAQQPVDWPRFLRDGQGRIEPTFDNIVKGCERHDFCGRWIAFDNFTFAVMWAPADQAGDKRQWRAWEDHDYIDLRIALERRGFKGFGQEAMRSIVNKVAKANAIDTAQEWLSRLKWDGVQRVNTYMSVYLGTADTLYTRAMGRYIWSALAGRLLSPGIQADMVPVLTGPQGQRKTSAIEAMCPTPDAFVEINLGHRDEDTSRRLRGKLVAELAELRGLQGRDKEDIKAFITRRKESWVPKYMEMEATFWRRLLFFGTTNKDEFLADPTGERRWLPVRSGTERAIDVDAIKRDREQLWAEGAVIYAAAGVDFEEAERLAPAEHEEFRKIDPWQLRIIEWLVTPDAITGKAPVHRPYEWGTDDVLTGALGLRIASIQDGHQQRVGAILNGLKAHRKRVWKAGWRYKIYADQLKPWTSREGFAAENDPLFG